MLLSHKVQQEYLLHNEKYFERQYKYLSKLYKNSCKYYVATSIDYVATSIDPMDIKAVETLVRTMDTGSGTDDLMVRLSNLYNVFSPTEYTMRRLSVLQQRFSNTGCLYEFCITCVYVAAMESLLAKLPDRIQRIKSHCTFEVSKMRKTFSCWF